MRTRHIVALALALLGTACREEVGEAPLDAAVDAPAVDGGWIAARPDAGPAPPACTTAPAHPLGGATYPQGPPAITWSSGEPIDADATVAEIALADAVLSIRITIGGAEDTLRIPEVSELPPLTVGDAVHVTTDVRYGGTAGSTQLVLSDATGVVAAYQRGSGFDWVRSQVEWLSGAIDVPLSAEPTCRTENGGQCGRGGIQYALVRGETRIEPGETATIGGSLALRSIVALDDGDAWFGEGPVCAIGTLVSFGADVVRR